eukprot:TRINITY_DN44966_c0_g1_i1.p1 TRINITY_DN44966_c0_g1~~TRINITY_DN44966_c0_g1_i1.p1  ORF type:complete len:766 (-),score=181.72 TRINITY_DN44966_c0_g1_i1:108-2405(-)
MARQQPSGGSAGDDFWPLIDRLAEQFVTLQARVEELQSAATPMPAAAAPTSVACVSQERVDSEEVRFKAKKIFRHEAWHKTALPDETGLAGETSLPGELHSMDQDRHVTVTSQCSDFPYERTGSNSKDTSSFLVPVDQDSDDSNAGGGVRAVSSSGATPMANRETMVTGDTMRAQNSIKPPKQQGLRGILHDGMMAPFQRFLSEPHREGAGEAKTPSFSEDAIGRHRSLMSRFDSFAHQEGKRHSLYSLRKNERQAVFADVEKMKEIIREKVFRPQYKVSDYYHRSGAIAAIAKSAWFEGLTLLVILVNALWLSYDTDSNPADFLFQAKTRFQVAENLFCAYFVIEILIRLFAFKRKGDCFQDNWFIFDAGLVIFMMADTWVLNTLMAGYFRRTDADPAAEDDAIAAGSRGNHLSVLRISRLLRLTRMARMAKLLRAVPELVVLIKGLLAALRSVIFTLVLIWVIIYIFSIAFTQLFKDTSVGSRFATVPRSMSTLWIRGTLLDEVDALMEEMEQAGFLCVALFNIYILVTALTLMNMLIGVLCDVICAVAAAEKEELTLISMRTKLLEIFNRGGDIDENCTTINQAEFRRMLEDEEAARALHELGVDVLSLVEVADTIFSSDPSMAEGPGNKQLSFAEFSELVLRHRGSNTVTIKDIMQLNQAVRMLSEDIGLLVRNTEKKDKAGLDERRSAKMRHRAASFMSAGSTIWRDEGARSSRRDSVETEEPAERAPSRAPSNRLSVLALTRDGPASTPNLHEPSDILN